MILLPVLRHSLDQEFDCLVLELAGLVEVVEHDECTALSMQTVAMAGAVTPGSALATGLCVKGVCPQYFQQLGDAFVNVDAADVDLFVYRWPAVMHG